MQIKGSQMGCLKGVYNDMELRHSTDIVVDLFDLFALPVYVHVSVNW